MMSERRGFTLIELLIVVAIIAILAAIAVPNFLEAQTRSKVSRVKADMRSAATALEAYAVDNNAFPFLPGPVSDTGHLFIEYVSPLSTPVAYITSTILRDPFTPAVQDILVGTPPTDWKETLLYVNYSDVWAASVDHVAENKFKKAFLLASNGPMRKWAFMEHYPYKAAWDPAYQESWPAEYHWPTSAVDCLYDPSNGTKSCGGIGRLGGDTGGIPQCP
jgi:prepilin-type N-terminal cleavage/methylation domain-containing protein